MVAAFPLRLAVASKDGRAISEHFGHAKSFRIYDVAPGQCKFLHERLVAHYCHGHRGDAGALGGILDALRDCRAVFVARIGDAPSEKLRAVGIEAVARYACEAIEDSLLDYAGRVAASGEMAPAA